jgi:hypothetical protein
MRNIRSSGGREWSEVVFSAAKFIQHFANPRFKSRQIFRYGFPDDGGIHAHVIMDELVTHPGYFPPRDLRVFLADGGWIFRAASPIISKPRMTAKNVFSSAAN